MYYVCICRICVYVLYVRICLWDGAQLKELADLLDKIFNMDPAKRITVAECLKHPFIKDLPA